MNSKARRRHKATLYEKQKGLCYWCGELMRLTTHKFEKKERMPDDIATIDHLDSRLNPQRGTMGGTIRHVLAHKGCNEKRAAAEVAALPIEEVRRRSALKKSA